MGLFSRSKKKTKTVSVGGVSGGAQTQTGDAFNIGASAGGNLSQSFQQTNNYTTTDHGAVEGAFLLGDSALDFAAEMGNASIDAANDISRVAINENSQLVGQAIDVTHNALNRVDENARLANQTVLQALDYNQALIREDGQTEQAGITRALVDNIPTIAIVGGVVLVASAIGGKK